MDQVPKIVRQRLQSTAKAGVHPDPDLLAGFAEKSLSQRERGQVLEHLSQCSDCRDVVVLASAEPVSTPAQFARAPRLRWPVLHWTTLRWGAVAACVVIVSAAVMFRREHLGRTSSPASSDRPAQFITSAKPAAEAQVSPPAGEKVAANLALPAPSSSRELAAVSRATKQPEPSGNPTGRMIAKSGVESRAIANAPAPAPPGTAADLDQQKQAPQEQGQREQIVVSGAANTINTESETVTVAHGQAISGNLVGTVLDSSGAAVANAEVTTINVGTAQVTPGSTDATGQYRFENLPIGNYRIAVKASGFRTTTELAEVRLNKTGTINVTLTSGDATETVEVEAQAGAVTTELAELTPERAKDAKEPQLKSKAGSSSAMIAGAGNYKLSAGARVQKAITLTPRWTLSPDGVLQRSLDGGRTWETIPVPATSALRALAAVGPDIWVGGAAGALYHSSDIGRHWGQIKPTADGKALTADIIGVTFSDATHGKLTTANDGTWTTSDAGQSWQKK